MTKQQQEEGERKKVKEIFDLDKEIDEEFRRTAFEAKGFHKGVLKESFEEAVVAWIREQKKKKTTK